MDSNLFELIKTRVRLALEVSRKATAASGDFFFTNLVKRHFIIFPERKALHLFTPPPPPKKKKKKKTLSAFSNQREKSVSRAGRQSFHLNFRYSRALVAFIN